MARTMKKSGSADYFGTFLDTLSSDSPAQTARPAPPAVPQPGGPILPRVLGYLSQVDGSSIPDLASGIGSSLVETAEVVGRLKESGLVAVSGDPGAERVELTEAGRTVSQLT
jgi:hypothetical protein